MLTSRTLLVLLGTALLPRCAWCDGERQQRATTNVTLDHLSAALPSICEAYVRAYVCTHSPGLPVEHDILFVAPVHYTAVLCRTGFPGADLLVRRSAEQDRFYYISESKVTTPLTACGNDGGLLRPLYNSFLLPTSLPYYYSSSAPAQQKLPPPPQYASEFQYQLSCNHTSDGTRHSSDGVDYTWTDWWVASTTPWRIPPPLKASLLAQRRPPAAPHSTKHAPRPSLVISTPGLGLQGSECCRPGNAAANCLSPETILRMATAADSLGFDTVLWPTVLSHGGVFFFADDQQEQGGVTPSADDQERARKTAAGAAISALQRLHKDASAPSGLRIMNHSISAALLDGDGLGAEADLATMAEGSVFASAFGAGGSAILSYMGGASCILCDNYRQQTPRSRKVPYEIGHLGAGMNGFLKGRFCRQEILESMSGQTVTIVHTQEAAISCVKEAVALASLQQQQQQHKEEEEEEEKQQQRQQKKKKKKQLQQDDVESFYPYERLFREARALWQRQPQLQPVAAAPLLKIGGKMHDPSPEALDYLCRVFRHFGADIPEVQRGMAPSRGFEFGPELILKLPVVYFLQQCGMVEVTRSCGDLSVFYFFSKKHENVECHRRGGQQHIEGASGTYFENSPIAFLPPPLRETYSQGQRPIPALRAGEKFVVVTNRLDCKACPANAPSSLSRGEGDSRDLCCKQYMSNRVLRRIMKSIERGARREGTPVRIIYNRVNHADQRLIGLSREGTNAYHDTATFQSKFTRVCPRWGCYRDKSQSQHELFLKYVARNVSEIDDEKMLKAEFPEVVLISDAYAAAIQEQHQNMSFNEFLVRTLSHASSFVSVQGGASYLVSYFGGCNEVCDFYGETISVNYAKHSEELRRQKLRSREQKSSGHSNAKSTSSSGRAVPSFGLHRRLHETTETYRTTLPRIGGAKVRHHSGGDELVDALESWWTDASCGLVSAASAAAKAASVLRRRMRRRLVSSTM